MTDATLVTGASGGRAPRKGEVLAERYEIVEVLASDALVVSYRAVDQESDAPVLVRCTAPGLLGERDARGLVERVRPLVGGGGRVVSALRAVDREGSMVLTIEPWPRGASLRSVLDARQAKGAGTLEPREALPVVARLATAIASIPEPYWHGDLRVERVYVDADGLVLTGGFLVSMLAGDLVSGTLEHEPGLRSGLPPELADGLGGRASDRWAVAAIAWEALTGASPGEGRLVPPRSLGQVGVELARLLDVDPAARPSTLDALVSALAELARLPVPQVEKDAFPGVDRASPEPDEATQVAELEAPPTDPSRRGSTIPAPPEPEASTLPFVLGDPPTERTSGLPSSSPDDTAPHGALDSAGKPRARDLDPRLVRAALAPDHDTLASGELELVDSKTEPGARVGPLDTVSDELDPWLVRAALGGAEATGASPPPAKKKRSAAVTQELGPGDLEELRASVPDAKARAAGKGALVAPPAAKPAAAKAAQPAAAAAKAAQPAATKRRRARDPEPVPLPVDIKPIPRPRVDESDELPAGPVLFDASRAVASAPVPPSAPGPTVVDVPTVAPLAVSPPAPTPGAVAPRAVRARARSVPPWASWVIVAAAVLFGIVIVGAGFWYRTSLQREADRQQMIEQRLRELQRTTP